MNKLREIIATHKHYHKLLNVQHNTIKDAVKDYQIEQLVKQCTEARILRNKHCFDFIQQQLCGVCTLTAIIIVPYLLLIAF